MFVCLHRTQNGWYLLSKWVTISLTSFFRDQYTFILQTSSDVIDLTCVFYQTIFQYILNGNFVLNKGNWKGTFWAQVKYNKIYMCVILVYFLTVCMSIFENVLLDDILLTLQTTLREKGGNEKWKRCHWIHWI